MHGRGGMGRIPGHEDEPSADGEARALAPLGEDLLVHSRLRAGLVTAAAIFGFATVALAYWVAPWHRPATILGGHPQRQGEKGTRLFHSMEDMASHLTEQSQTGQQADAAYVGSREIYVEKPGVFKVGDSITIADPSGDSSKNEEGVVASVEADKLTLERPVSKSLAPGSIVVANDQFNCDAGFDKWIAGWSEHKKKVCCASEGKGCTFDCAAGSSLRAAGWSDKKKEYCCETEQKGCGASDKTNETWAVVVWLFFLLVIFACVVASVLGCFFVCKGNVQSSHGFLKSCPNSLNSLATWCCSQRTVDSKKGTRNGKEWIFKPSDGLAIMTLTVPEFNAPETGKRLEPRERFSVSQEKDPNDGEFKPVSGGVVMQDSLENGDCLFLELADGRGWVLDREPGHEMCYKLFEPVDELWVYRPENGNRIAIREEPDVEGGKTGEMLFPGDRFVVSEIHADDEGVLFLRLQDGRGWVFDEGPDGDIMCRRCLDELWVYQPENGKPIRIRLTPDVYGELTRETVLPDESFGVSEIEEGEDGVKYLRLQDGRGWLFDRHPELGAMCYEA